MTPAEVSIRIEEAISATVALFNATHPSASNFGLSMLQQVAIFERWRDAISKLPSAGNVDSQSFQRAYVAAVAAGVVPLLKSHAKNLQGDSVPATSWHHLAWQYVEFHRAMWLDFEHLEPNRAPAQALSAWVSLVDATTKRGRSKSKEQLPAASEFVSRLVHERTFLACGANLGSMSDSQSSNWREYSTADAAELCGKVPCTITRWAEDEEKPYIRKKGHGRVELDHSHPFIAGRLGK